MKSIINSDEVKVLVSEAVEKALIECATQHEVNNDFPDFDPGYLKNQPVILKLTLNFHWQGDENNVMFCQPVIDLSHIDNK